MKWCTAKIRLSHVRLFAQAMLGEADKAIAQLDDLAQQLKRSEHWTDYVGTRQVQAQILSLERRGQESLDVFDSEIEPYLDRIDQKLALIVGDNRKLQGMTLLRFDDGNRFYGLHDQMRFSGLEIFDASDILDARAARAKGAAHQSLPIVWSALMRAYDLGSWRAMHFAESEMSLECLNLGLLDDAAWHAVLAQDVNLAVRVAEAIMNQPNNETTACSPSGGRCL